MAIVLGPAQAAIYAAMNTYLPPIPAGLTGPEQAAIIANRQALAFVIATACTYVQQNAVVEPGTMAVIPADMAAPSGGGPLTGDGIVKLGTGILL